MDFTDLQMTLSGVVVLTAAAVVVFFFEQWRQQRRQLQHPQRVRSRIHSVAPPQRPIWILHRAPLGYAPAKKPASTEIQLPAATLPDSTLPAITIDTALLERLIDQTPARPTMQQPALEVLLESADPFTGLVVAIGINDTDSSMWHSQGLMQSVGSYIASLLRENDRSCRTSYDEFVMLCPGEQSAESQRRLNQIAERLWEYQLRGASACSILLNWGGVQVQNRPLAEAIASATERMRETRRIGNSSQSALAHRQAV
jgi:GGDEF domain-containing protein